jgi:2,4-dienoyl-CoA reductase-like NADH-dependent reductase (Old Yellow Enzyme family)
MLQNHSAAAGLPIPENFMDEHSIFFKPTRLGRKTAPNALAANPAEFNDCLPDGAISERALKRYRTLAEGNWGVICIESTTASIDPADRAAGIHCPMLNENTVGSFKRLVETCRSENPQTLLLVQLSTGNIGMGDAGATVPADRIEQARRYLVEAALAAAKAGFDGVDIKQCHGFLPHYLISGKNKRSDRWGGEDLKERSKFFSSAVRDIRAGLGSARRSDFLIGTRISENDITEVGRLISLFDKELHLDFVNISASPSTDAPPVFHMLCCAVRALKPSLSIIGSGYSGYLGTGHSLQDITATLESGSGPDFIGFGRQWICEPHFPEKIRSGDLDSVHWCTLCDRCFESFSTQTEVYCREYPQAW